MSTVLTKEPKELVEKFFSLTTPQDVAALLEVDYGNLIYHIYKESDHKRYRTFYVSKKSGGQRKISAPISALKIIQRKLNFILQHVYKQKPGAHGFLFGRSIVTNARIHARSEDIYLLNLDLSDFFPSINFGRVRGMFMGIPYGLPPEVATILAQICCFDDELPQGAPTSPIVSNMICAKMDSQLDNLAYDYRCSYSRYADDITFSSSSRWAFPQQLAFVDAFGKIELGHELQQIIGENGFEVNPQKIRLRNKYERQEVTGLTVNRERPNVNRTFVRQVRAMLHAWEKYGFDAAQKDFETHHDEKHRNSWSRSPSFRNVLRGKIEFLGMVRGREDLLYVKALEWLKRLEIRDRLSQQQENSAGASQQDISARRPGEDEEGLPPTMYELFLTQVDNTGNFNVIVLKPQYAESEAASSLPYNLDELTAILKLLPNGSVEEARLKPHQTQALTDLGLLDQGVPVPDLVKRVGNVLFKTLFPGSIGEEFQGTLNRLDKSKPPVELRLRFSEKNVNLTRYPWELLSNNRHSYLLLDEAVHLTRYINHSRAQWTSFRVKDLKKVLYIEARPHDLDMLPTDEHTIVYNTLKSLNSEITVEKLSRPTFDAFEDYVHNSSADVLHFDGHGAFARQCPKCQTLNYPHHESCQAVIEGQECGYNLHQATACGYLMFEKDDDSHKVDYVESEVIGRVIANSKIQLAVLSACQSGETRGNTIFSGVGPAMILAGVPAVVAMQLPITPNAAADFIRVFYDTLVKEKTLAVAIRSGRRKLQRTHQWFVPVMYWRNREKDDRSQER